MFVRSHLYHLKLYSDVLRRMGFNFPEEDLNFDPGELIPESVPTENSKIDSNRSDVEILLTMLHCANNVQSYLAQNLHGKAGISLMSDEWIGHWDAEDSVGRQSLAHFKARDVFEQIAVDMLPKHFPALYLEGYSFLRENIRQRFPACPRLIVTALGWYRSESLKMLAAESMNQGGRLIAVQHGAIYGTYNVQPTREHEIRISDRFIAWGWADPNDQRFINLPCIQTSGFLEDDQYCSGSNDSWEVLFLANQVIRYFQDFRTALKSYGSDEYLQWQLRFLHAVPVAIREELCFRYKKGHQAAVWEYLLERFPEIHSESRNIALNQRIRDVRICVVDCCTQVYVEAMLLRPTILYWDPNVWQVSRSAEFYFDRLRLAGILYHSPEEAARKLTEIYGDPLPWWNSETVRHARTDFLNHFALPHGDWREVWTKALDKEFTLTRM